MLATVIISTHNRRQGLTELLDDLRKQDIDSTQFEVLIVNSPGGEDVSDVVNEYALSAHNGRQLLTINIVAAKRNEGARQSRSALLIFLDDDLRIPINFVSTHVAAHGASPALISGQVVFPEEWISTRNFYRYKNSRHLNSQNKVTDGMPVQAHRVVSMNCSIPARAYEQVGGFSEAFVNYGGEDVEFGFRCSRHGLELLYSSGPIGIHKEVQGNVTTFVRRIYVSSLTGTRLLLSAAPDASAVPTFRWTEPGLAANNRDKAVHQALRSLSHPRLIRGILHVLESTDRVKWFYVPLAFKVVTLMSTQLGVLDRLSGRDRREALGCKGKNRRETLQGEAAVPS